MNLTLRNKLIAAFGMMILLFTVLTSVVFFKMSKVRTQFTLVMDHDTPVVANANRLLRLIVDMETGQRGFCLTRQEKFLEPYHKAITEFDVLLTREMQLVSIHPSQVEKLQHINALLTRWHETAAGPEIAAARKIAASEDSDQANMYQDEMIALFREGSGKALIDEIREAFVQFIQVENQHMVQRFSKASQTMRSAHKVIAIGLGFTVLFGSFIAVVLTREFAVSVSHLLKGADVIGSGNWDQRIEVRSHDEVGQLTESFNMMAARLKELEKSSRESHARYKMLSDVALEAVAIHEDGEILDVNDNFCDMFGYTLDELHNVDGFLLFSPGSRNMAMERVRTAYSLPYEAIALKKDGTEFSVLIQAKNVKIGDKNCRVASIRDLTSVKEMESAMESYREKIVESQRYAYINSIGATVAHQLNQPLTTVNLILGQLKADVKAKGVVDPAIIEQINTCLVESNNTTQIINQFRQSVQNASWDSRTSVKVQDVAEKTMSALASRSKRARLEFQLQGLNVLPEIVINENVIEQIFYILSQNAIDASDPQRWNHLAIEAKCQNGTIVLNFRDDCGGVSVEDEEYIFDPLFSTKQDKHGLGLGLEIVHRLLMINGGNIKLNNQPGIGAEFVVTLTPEKGEHENET